jgi:hypothetical protein
MARGEKGAQPVEEPQEVEQGAGQEDVSSVEGVVDEVEEGIEGAGALVLNPEQAAALQHYQPTEGDATMVLAALVENKIGTLTDAQKLMFLQKKCELQGIDLRMQPYIFTKIDGKLVVMPTKHMGEQIRAIRDVSVVPVEEWMNPDLGIYYLKLMGFTADGRVDYEVGIVPIGTGVRSLTGGPLADQIAICWTRAKGRLSQSLGGLAPTEEQRGRAIPEVVQTIVGELRKKEPAKFELRDAARAAGEAPGGSEKVMRRSPGPNTKEAPPVVEEGPRTPAAQDQADATLPHRDLVAPPPIPPAPRTPPARGTIASRPGTTPAMVKPPVPAPRGRAR